MVFSPRILALALLACLVASGAHAQSNPFGTGLPSIPRTGSINGADDIALEGSVDETEYLVGPGDTFLVAIGGGSAARQFTAVVTADGRLVIPEAGTFNVAGRTLESVRRQSEAALGRRYTNVTTAIALASPRRFSVHVTGAVPEPGRHAVRAAARVEDALMVARPATAMRDSDRLTLDTYRQPVSTTRREARPAYRNVTVRHTDGTESRIDIARYLVTGDTRYNPYLQDGDAVHLPTFDPSREGVFVSGDVPYRGVYDTRPGDTALALLTLASGDRAESTIRAFRVTRMGGRDVTDVPLAEAAAFQVQPRDQIYAIGLAPEAGTATALGSVRYPGTYPITSGVTTLRSLLDMAGGLADDALVRGAYIERSAQSEPEAVRAEVSGEESLLSAAPRLSRLDSLSLGIGRLSGLDFVSRRLFVQETFRTPRLSVDLADALASGDDIALEDGDRLVVPEDFGLVRVYGQVVRPGYVPYSPGLAPEAYVQAVGGVAPSATDVYVVDAATGLFASGGLVREGDAVYVDREPTADTAQLESLALQNRQLALQTEQIQIQDRQLRQQGRFQLYQTIISTVGAVATVIFAVEALRN
ncbi:SLBB domain-containing protein [Rubricoccus marinus]|uniref:Uncharacterized protein n=1 Tax=Rubricoccus marinus TaxID=716817 RepID=A0A259TZR2_9BACT|nr:SLBB domain-containing protein [Rubricoccus marinus]OZC03087.1 hypothetical protein BSZ36_08945 [Rubricoccus marinus]